MASRTGPRAWNGAEASTCKRRKRWRLDLPGGACLMPSVVPEGARWEIAPPSERTLCRTELAQFAKSKSCQPQGLQLSKGLLVNAACARWYLDVRKTVENVAKPFFMRRMETSGLGGRAAWKCQGRPENWDCTVSLGPWAAHS